MRLATPFQNQETLEKALKQIRDELKTERPTEDPKPSQQPQVVGLAPGVKAAVAKTREELEVVDLI